jgi:hypothetical protein
MTQLPTTDRLRTRSTRRGIDSQSSQRSRASFPELSVSTLTTGSRRKNGNVLTSNGYSFKYDFANRLKSANGGAIMLVYDGDGNRVAKTVGGVTTQYLVDELNPTGLPQVVEELVSGAVQRIYTYGLQRINENQLISGVWTPSFYGYDGGGHVRLLTDTRDGHGHLHV